MPGPILDALSSTMELSNPFTSPDMVILPYRNTSRRPHADFNALVKARGHSCNRWPDRSSAITAEDAIALGETETADRNGVRQARDRATSM